MEPQYDVLMNYEQQERTIYCDLNEILCRGWSCCLSNIVVWVIMAGIIVGLAMIGALLSLFYEQLIAGLVCLSTMVIISVIIIFLAYKADRRHGSLLDDSQLFNDPLV